MDNKRKKISVEGLEGKAINIDFTQAESGQRLDMALAGLIDGMSRSRVKTLILEGNLTQNGKTLKQPSRRVSEGDSFNFIIPITQSAIPQGQNIPLNILFEDEDLIVIDKPAGLVVHPAPGNPDRTLVNALISHCGESLKGIGGEARPGIVHRLDKNTSGAMVVAKTSLAHESLSKQFSDRSVDRAYRAIGFGSPKAATNEIKTLIGRSPNNRKKMAVVNRNGKTAITNYKIERVLGTSVPPFASVLICKLLTGRTHQIRVHLNYIGNSIIGDPLYFGGKKSFLKNKYNNTDFKKKSESLFVLKNFNRQALHAFQLGFKHPRFNKKLHFETKLPNDMENLINSLESF